MSYVIARSAQFSTCCAWMKFSAGDGQEGKKRRRKGREHEEGKSKRLEGMRGGKGEKEKRTGDGKEKQEERTEEKRNWEYMEGEG